MCNWVWGWMMVVGWIDGDKVVFFKWLLVNINFLEWGIIGVGIRVNNFFID